jgi:hypothetical protein
MTMTGETEERGENLLQFLFFTTNSTWTDPGANPGLRAERLATNRLSYGMALSTVTCLIFIKITKLPFVTYSHRVNLILRGTFINEL